MMHMPRVTKSAGVSIPSSPLKVTGFSAIMLGEAGSQPVKMAVVAVEAR